MRLAESEDDALLTLEILDRAMSRSWRPFMGIQNRSVVAVRLTAGDFRADFTGDGRDSGAFTGYRKAAGKILKQMDDWVKTNRLRILAIKRAMPVEQMSPPK